MQTKDSFGGICLLSCCEPREIATGNPEEDKAPNTYGEVYLGHEMTKRAAEAGTSGEGDRVVPTSNGI